MFGFLFGLLMAAMNAVAYVVMRDPVSVFAACACLVIGVACLVVEAR